MSQVQIFHHVYEHGGHKDDVLIENDGGGKWIAYLLPMKEVLVKCNTLEECKIEANKILDEQDGVDLAIVIFGLAKDVDEEEFKAKMLETLEGRSLEELQVLSSVLMRAHLALPYKQLITEGLHEKLGIAENSINGLACIAMQRHDESSRAIGTSDDKAALQEAIRLLAKGSIDAAYALIEEYELWDEIAPFLEGESKSKVRGKASLIANMQWPVKISEWLPFRWALYKRFGRQIKDIIKEMVREGIKRNDLYFIISLCFMEALYKDKDEGKKVLEKLSNVFASPTSNLSKEGRVAFGKIRPRLTPLIKEILAFIEEYSPLAHQKQAHVEATFAAFISNANLMPGQACIQLRKPLGMVLKEVREKFAVPIEGGMAKLREEYPALTQKEFSNIIETILAREFKHRDVFSLPKLSNDENRVVIKYKDNVSAVARRIYEFAKRRVMLGTWDETLEILDFIQKIFVDGWKNQQSSNMLIDLDTALITTTSGLAPQELILVSIDEIKAELHRQFSEDIKALVTEMRGYGNVSSKEVYKTIESYINTEEFGKIADVIPRQHIVKALKQVYGNRTSNLVKTIVSHAKELVELFVKQNDKQSSPINEAFTLTRQVFMDVIEEGRELIDIIYDKWLKNDKLVAKLQQQVNAIKRAVKISFLAGKTTSEFETTWGIILELFKANFAGVFEENLELNDEEKTIASKFEPAFREVCQSELVADLAIVKEQGAQGELIRRLYQLVIAMSRKDATKEKSALHRIKTTLRKR